MKQSIEELAEITKKLIQTGDEKPNCTNVEEMISKLPTRKIQRKAPMLKSKAKKGN